MYCGQKHFYKFQHIWSMKTKVREQKQKWDKQRDRKMIKGYILNALSSYDRAIKNAQEFFR